MSKGYSSEDAEERIQRAMEQRRREAEEARKRAEAAAQGAAPRKDARKEPGP